MKFLLDTDTCVYALKQNPAVLKRLLAQSREDVAISVITEAELRTGVAKSTSGGENFAPDRKFPSSPWHCRIYVERRGFVCSSAREARAGRNTDWSTRDADCSASSGSQTRPCF
jgi:predicted nucleic acid-binding protein